MNTKIFKARLIFIYLLVMIVVSNFKFVISNEKEKYMSNIEIK